MKKLIVLLFPLIFALIQNVSAQEESSKQLWYCWEETVNPGMINEYIDMNKKLIEICKEEEFKFSFHAFTTGDLKYQWYHPINSLADIDAIEKEWDRIMEKFGNENAQAFQKTLMSTNSYTFSERHNLSFIPETPRMSMDSMKYMRLQEFYVIPGKGKEITDIIKEANEFLKSKKYNDAWYMATGEIGLEGPVFIGWSFGTSMEDYWNQDKLFNEKYGEDFKVFNERFIKCLKSVVNKDSWYLQDLSYINN